MRRWLLVLLCAITAAGCGLTSPRQTLADLDDGRSVFAEGRPEVCLGIESAEDEVLASVCDLVEDPLGMTEYAAFGGGGAVVLVGVVPLDVVAVEVVVDGEEQQVATIPSDLTTGFFVVELPPDAGEVEVIGRDESGEPVDAALVVDVPSGAGTTSGTEGS